MSYWTTPSGLAIIEGNVVYGIEDELVAHQVNDSETGVIQARAFSAPNIWPGVTVLCKYDSATSEALVGSIVNPAIAAWKNTASTSHSPSFNRIPPFQQQVLSQSSLMPVQAATQKWASCRPRIADEFVAELSHE